MPKKKEAKEPVDWLRYENEAMEGGSLVICGVDEAGRGPLAGPVFAAASSLRKRRITVSPPWMKRPLTPSTYCRRPTLR